MHFFLQLCEESWTQILCEQPKGVTSAQVPSPKKKPTVPVTPVAKKKGIRNFFASMEEDDVEEAGRDVLVAASYDWVVAVLTFFTSKYIYFL